MNRNAGTFVQIDVVPDLEEIEEQLGSLKDKAPVVLKKALNDTAKWTGRELAKEAQARYQVKTMKFAKEFTISRASNGRLQATLTAEGFPLALSKFKLSPPKPIVSESGSPAAKVAILQGRPIKEVTNAQGKKAFVTEFSSGHIAVVQRQPGQKYTSKGWKDRKSKWKKYKKRTGRLDNTRIKELYGPSVPKMLEKTGVTKEYLESDESKILEHLKAAVTKHINTEIYFASKGKKS